MWLILPSMNLATSAGLMQRRSVLFAGKGEVTLLVVSQYPGLIAVWAAAGLAPAETIKAKSAGAQAEISRFIGSSRAGNTAELRAGRRKFKPPAPPGPAFQA